MAACEGYEVPTFSVLDAHDVDRLLVKLRAIHGEGGRPDIAPQLRRAARDRLREKRAENARNSRTGSAGLGQPMS
jgi:hypothetical protein